MKHSPTPWKKHPKYHGTILIGVEINGIGEDYTITFDGPYGDEPIDDDIDFVLRAVNSHDALIAASSSIAKYFKPYGRSQIAALRKLKEIIAAAEGEETNGN